MVLQWFPFRGQGVLAFKLFSLSLTFTIFTGTYLCVDRFASLFFRVHWTSVGVVWWFSINLARFQPVLLWVFVLLLSLLLPSPRYWCSKRCPTFLWGSSTFIHYSLYSSDCTISQWWSSLILLSSASFNWLWSSSSELLLIILWGVRGVQDQPQVWGFTTELTGGPVSEKQLYTVYITGKGHVHIST